jgi:hypothetical protein
MMWLIGGSGVGGRSELIGEFLVAENVGSLLNGVNSVFRPSFLLLSLFFSLWEHKVLNVSNPVIGVVALGGLFDAGFSLELLELNGLAKYVFEFQHVQQVLLPLLWFLQVLYFMNFSQIYFKEKSYIKVIARWVWKSQSIFCFTRLFSVSPPPIPILLSLESLSCKVLRSSQ